MVKIQNSENADQTGEFSARLKTLSRTCCSASCSGGVLGVRGSMMDGADATKGKLKKRFVSDK
jgi:hypothetical protein